MVTMTSRLVAMAVLLTAVGCASSQPKQQTKPAPPPAPAPTKPAPVTTKPPPQPTAKPAPNPQPAPPPSPAPISFTKADKEAACHAMFDHVFDMLRGKQNLPIKGAQLDKIRKQAMPMCVQKITPEIADCIMAAMSMPEVQQCAKRMRP